jgi:predicted MFS family arabinose efflux permease
VSFLASAALIATMAAPGAPGAVSDRTEEPTRSWRELWPEWRDGLRVVAGSRVLLVLFAVGAVANVTEGMSAPLFVPFIEEVLEGGATEIGVWFATNGVGVLLGGAVVVTLARRVPPARLLGMGYVGVGLFCAARNVAPVALPAMVPGLPPASAMIVNPVVGALAVAVFAAHPTLLQQAVPDAYRGRVFGALGTTDAAAMLGGAALATALGDALGPLPFFHALAAAYVACGAVVLLVLPDLAPRVDHRPRR